MNIVELSDRARRFFREKSGNVFILFAFALPVFLGFAALVIDYGNALSAKTRLNAAADAAALAAITQGSYDVTQGQTTAAAISDGDAQALRAFKTNAAQDYPLLASPPTITLTRTGQTFTATVAYQGSMGTHFAGILHWAALTLAGSSNASLTMGTYLNFYLLLDVSGSMAIPSTASEINRLAAIDPDYRNLYPGGCILACHFTAYKACQNAQGQTVACQGYNLSRNGGNSQNSPVSFCQYPGTSACIQLRVDAVAYAVEQLLQTAQNPAIATLPNQFRVGLYPFIVQADAYEPLTANLSTVNSSAAGLTSLLDNGVGLHSFKAPNGRYITLGSGGSNLNNALSYMISSNNIPSNMIGDGSSSTSPRPFVFFVTDGAQDNQTENGAGGWSGSNNATTLDTAYCTQLKNRGITLAVLYIPYVPIPNPTTIWNNEDGAANANIPNIPPSLQACASPGFFFTASSPTDINNAMQQMFAQSLQAARLTH